MFKKSLLFIGLMIGLVGCSVAQEADVQLYVEEQSSLGGYKLFYPGNWTIGNKQSLEEGLDFVIFVRDDDNTQTITLAIKKLDSTEESYDIVEKLNDSLIKKNIEVKELYREQFEVDGNVFDAARAELDNSRSLMICDFYSDEFSIIGTLGSKSNDTIKNMDDLITIFTLFNVKTE